MLYDYWRQVAAATPNETALTEVGTGRRWTFSDLATAAEGGLKAGGSIAFLESHSADFVLNLLRAWRFGQVVCPFEKGHPAPATNGGLAEQVVHLKTTSATTGVPRLVAFTAPQLMADARNIVRTMGLRPDWPNVGVISLAHSYGFSNLVLPLLLHGIPLILAEAPLPEAMRHASQSQPAVTLAAVPALWRTWHDAGAILPNIRLGISAGAPLPLGLEREIHAMAGLKVHNFYGSSECGGIAYDPSDTPRTDGACVGQPLDQVEVSLGDDGCLEVRSGAVAETYWPEPSPKLGGGVFRTNDLADLADGWVYLRGRACDQINVAGRKVLPETVERAITAHPLVRACLAFGVPSPDAQRGETIVACVTGDRSITGEALRQFTMARLPAWQVPRDWWFVDALEVNGRGKLSRADWRKRYLSEVGRDQRNESGAGNGGGKPPGA
jgi:long-chain acyl-CoA synthetase